MVARSLLAVSIAFALVLPLGTALVTVGAVEVTVPTVMAQNVPGGIEVLPYATAGVPTLRSLPVVSGLVASEADLLKAEPSPLSVSSIVPNAGEWLRDVHQGGLEADVEVWDGLQLASHTTVVIDTNVQIAGTVVYDHVTLEFTTADVGHRTIEVLEGGSLTITNSVVRGQDLDYINYGLIQARGDLNLDNNRFEAMVVYSQDAAAEPDQHLITNNFFTNSPYGIQTDRDNVVIQDNTFFKNSVGVYVLQPRQGGFLVASNPDVLENTFEMNEIGILLYTDQASGDADPVGLYRNNVIRANLIGVQCLSNGWTNPDNADDTRPPRFEANNIYSNWGDAVNNLRGITIIVPFIGPVSVADSACLFDGNYFGTDSLFTSSADTVQNNANAPLALSSTPALPYPLTVITTATTWNSGNPAPPITGPVIVASGGHLTIQDITLNTAFTVGSAKGGRLTVQDVTVNNGNGIVVRNDNDVVDDSSFIGTQLFSPVTVFRNNATVSDSTFVGGGRDRGTAISLVAGQFTEDFTWSPDLLRNTISNARVGVSAVTMTVTMTGNTLRDIGTPDVNYPLQPLLTGGFTAVIVTLNSQDNTYERVGSVHSGQLLTLTANGDTYDGGLTAFNSFQLNTVSITDSLIANFEFGLFNILESSVTVSDSNFTHNAYGLWAGVVNPTVSGTNFYNNYLAALYPYTTSLNAGGEQLVTATITCTSCFSLSDESWLNLYGSSVTYSSALSPNDVPKPSWESHIKSVSGAGNTLTLSGTLQGPAVARNGGELKIEGTDLDLGGRFSIGAKGGGNSGGSTGKVTVVDSVLTNGGFLALNGTASTVKNSVFRDFTSGADLFSVLWNGPLVECNKIDMGKGYPGRVLDIKSGNTAARFFRNSIVKSGDLDVGFGLRGDVFHNSTLTFERNSYAQGTTALGALWMLQNGTHSVKENNFLSNPRGSAFNTSMVNRTAGGFASKVTALNAQDNYYSHASGPSVRHGLDTELNPNGAGLRLNAHVLGPAPQWSPYASTAHSLDPCLSWRFSPSGPRDYETVSFDSGLSFDPSGFPLSYSWDFNGEGSSTAANPTFKFPDGGAKTVTLTVTTAGGKTASLSKTLSVSHSAPVANFVNTVANEVTAMDFTDTSTHPNSPVDAPPTGWTFAWNLGGESSSSARNPVYTWLDGGAKTVTLTVTDNDGQTHNVQKTVNVAHVPPVAAFTVSGGLETDTFQLSDASTHPNAPTDAVVTRSWSCTDGFTSSAANPSHKFADGGSYSCTLTVTDNDGQSSSVTKSIAVGHVAPAAGFLNGAANELQVMAFTDATTHPNAPTDAPPTGYTYAWTFGDGGTSGVRNPSHDFADGGDYSVGLTVTDNDGQTSSVSRSVSVPHVPPVALFSFAPANPDIGELVQFSDLSSHPNAPVDRIVSWSWSFGDGATSTAQNPTHAYADNGLFDAVLTVTDDDGQTASLTIRVPVGNTPPVVAFSVDPTTPTDLEDAQFTDLSTDEDGTIVSWLWAFGDGATSTEQNPVHRFDDNGLYTVTLTVTDNLGAASTLSQVVQVLNVAPTAGFTYGPDTPSVNEVVTFADTSTDPDGSVVDWFWDFGDGTTSTAQNPSHAFTAGGDYTVALTVTDDDGAVTTTTQTVHVCETGLDLDELRLEFCLRIEL